MSQISASLSQDAFVSPLPWKPKAVPTPSNSPVQPSPCYSSSLRIPRALRRSTMGGMKEPLSRKTLRAVVRRNPQDKYDVGRLYNEDDFERNTTVLVRTSCVQRMSFGREPTDLICKNCGMFVTTEISRHNGVCAFFTVLVSLFLCTPCAWIPLVAPTCKDTLHSCPNCGATIGIHRYFK